MSERKTVPLSSMDMVPLTDQTRQGLLAVGVKADRMRGLSEMGGQSLLICYQQANDPDGVHAPDCFQTEYDPAASLCAGCVYQPRCWRNDRSYLAKLADGDIPAPVGVPASIVKDRLEALQSQGAIKPPPPPVKVPKAVVRAPAPPPPVKAKKAPPPPAKPQVAARIQPPPPPRGH